MSFAVRAATPYSTLLPGPALGLDVVSKAGVHVTVGVLVMVVGVAVSSEQVLIRTETLSESWFATTRSGSVSLSTSAAATDNGRVPAAKFTAARSVPLPLPSSTDTLLDLLFVVTTSKCPSPLKSPT